MQVSNPNEIKIYNLSQGPTLPEWLANRKSKKDDVSYQRRVELIQDFEMPHITDGVVLSSDGHYIMTHGVYKPRIRCYDVRNLSMKFERCTDSEIVKMLLLSDDYAKPVLLQADRYVEFHAQYGRYYRTRIPKPGRDFLYHPEHSELFFVGAMPEIHRLNLERGQFLKPLMTEAPENNVCALNDFHRLFLCGTQDGKIEAWDPRDRRRVGSLDVAIHSLSEDVGEGLQSIPEVTALSFKDSLVYGVGLSNGKALVFDLRADKPIVVKDHQNDFPIKKILFHKGNQWPDLVMTADAKAVKMWRHDAQGKAVTSIEPEARINDLCVVDGNSGLLFIPSETQKVQVYYLPSLGLAPKWCHFLDNLTEELEENPNTEVYDNYKFVTQTELDSLGLNHLVGTPLLRAYMHGHFIDLRLYRKVKNMTNPLAYDEYKKEKVKEKIKAITQSRVDLDELPTVNRDLALKMAEMKEGREEEDDGVDGGDKRKNARLRKKSAKVTKAAGFLADDRFQKMFENPDFQIDRASEEYKNIQPIVESLEKRVEEKKGKKKAKMEAEEAEDEREEMDDGGDDDDDDESDDDDNDDDVSSSSDEEEFSKKLRQKFKDRNTGARNAVRDDMERADRNALFSGSGTSGGMSHVAPTQRRIFDVERKKSTKDLKMSLAERTARASSNDDGDDVRSKVKVTVGGRESTFVPKSRPDLKGRDADSTASSGLKKPFSVRRKEEKEAEYHRRKKERRGAGGILPKPKLPPKFYMGKRVQ